ncbi:Major Facilitator Superfamily protein [Corynebacterium auris]|nr:MFS transporter [Corynebacterium auris]WJY68359.1 Major Facilitator Superfamily protein [Corynebacterium auris]
MRQGRAAGVLTPAEVESVTNPWQARGLIPTLVAVAAAFGAWALLLPVVPTAVLDSGGSETLAGASTGLFMLSTVITQVFMPRVLRIFGYRAVIVAASLLLGLPALGFLAGMDAAIVVVVSLIRGVGFGALSVAEAAMIAQLVPLRLLGRTTGIFGVCVGGSQMVALPLGLALAERIGYPLVFLIATGIGMVGLAVCMLIPTIENEPEGEGELTGVHVPTWRLVAVPMLALTFVTTAYGAVTNFLPVSVREIDPAAGATFAGALLSVLNLAAMGARYYAGVTFDRRGTPGTVMIPFQVIAAAGIALTALVVVADLSVWWLVPAIVLYGAGFGAVQNESLTQLFYRLPKSKTSEASAMWNIAYDSGTGIGSLVYGAILGGVTMGGMYAIASAVILTGVAITGSDRFLGRHRVAEVDNLAVRLRSVQAPRIYRRGGR